MICYLNQAIIPICTVTTLIYPPLLTTIRGAYFPRLTKSRWGMPARRAPDRLAALLTAFRLVYRVLPAPDFHRRERPQSTCTRPIFILPTCQSRHTSSYVVSLRTGGMRRNRTSDAQGFNLPLFQLSYHPIALRIFVYRHCTGQRSKVHRPLSLEPRRFRTVCLGVVRKQ